MNILNLGTEVNRYKSAKCGCGKKLVQGERIAWVLRMQGRFSSVSNYHLECFDKVLEEAMNEFDTKYKNLMSASAEIDMAKLKV
jgi:chromatin remodeling complex protein RSC6